MSKKQKWTTQNNYTTNKKSKTTWDMKRKKPKDYDMSEHDVSLITVPGQTITIKQLMQRYEKGRPIPEQ